MAAGSRLLATGFVRIVHSARYHIDIGLHVFPTKKYELVGARTRVSSAARAVPFTFIEPRPATWDELALVHTPEYLDKLRNGTMTADDVAQLELPWSEEMVDGFRLMVGGTIDAACLAC